MSSQHRLTPITAAALTLLLPVGARAVAGTGQHEEKKMTKQTSPPIACSLSSSELQERKAKIENELLPRVLEITESANGYLLWFPNAEGELGRLAEFVEVESRCCPFLDFEVRLAAGSDRISLLLEGPEGTKEVLSALVER